MSETQEPLPCPLCGPKGDPDPEGWASATEHGPACNVCQLSTHTAEDWNRLPRPATKQADDWQPIETAPTDANGPAILLWHRNNYAMTGYPADAEHFNCAGRWSRDVFTHWLPLPKAPSTHEQREG